MRVGHVSPFERSGFFSRYRWPLALTGAVAVALCLPLFAARGPQLVIYPTRDFTQLPLRPTALATPGRPESCASIQHAGGSPKLVEEVCGSTASTFRIIDRVSDVSRCVRDADQTYSWKSGTKSGAVCLDYDWAADQCLRIAKRVVTKVGCAEQGAVLPEMAVIGAVDVSYCREGGIAHPVRRFTVCTLAGKNCKGRPIES
jgi:hypothetical protein